MRKNTVETREWLQKRYPQSAPSKTTVRRWFAKFKYGRTDTSDTGKHRKSPRNRFDRSRNESA